VSASISDRKPEIRSLTGVRIVAAVAVLISHSFDIVVGLFPSMDRFSAYAPIGDLGVGVFFVLSGFILFYNYESRFREGITSRGYATFVRRRFARIYPNQLATLALIAIIVYGIGGQHAEEFDAPLSNLPYQLTLTQGFYWERGTELFWNQPSWSISAEWAMYLLFPVLVFLAVRLRVRWLLILAFVPFAIEVLLSTPNVQFASGLISIMGFFPAGVVLGVLLTRYRLKVPRPDLVVIVATVLIIFCLGQIHNYWRLPLLLLGGLLILPVMQCQGLVKGFLASRTAVYLGRASYAIYMIHDIVLRFLRPTLLSAETIAAPPFVRFGALVMLYASVAIAGILLFRLIEVPAERWLRGEKGFEPETRSRAPQMEVATGAGVATST
jgi:peptidoglycan/LPS O-acetylase OafA/YrhL